MRLRYARKKDSHVRNLRVSCANKKVKAVNTEKNEATVGWNQMGRVVRHILVNRDTKITKPLTNARSSVLMIYIVEEFCLIKKEDQRDLATLTLRIQTGRTC